MEQTEKVMFINDLIDSVKEDILKKVDKMPEQWDGIELRWHIAEKFNREVFGTYDKKSSRYNDYENDVIVENL